MSQILATTGQDELLQGQDFKLLFARQTAAGALNSPLVLTPLRNAEGSLTNTPTYANSPEKPQDREALTQIQESSEIPMEISSGVSKQFVEHFIAALLGGDETIITQTAITFAATLTGFTGPSGAFTNIQAKDLVFFDGFDDEALNTFYIVQSKTDNQTIVTSVAPASVETAGASVTFTCNKSTTGNEPTLYIAQQQVPDESVVDDVRYFTCYDGIIDSASFEIPETGPLTSSLSLRFARSVPGTAAVAGQSQTAFPSDEVLTTVQNISQFIVNGEYAKCKIASMSFEFGNNYISQALPGCGYKYGAGTITFSGSLTAISPRSNPFVFRDYFEQGTNIAQIGVVLNHGAGEYSVIIADYCKITEHEQATSAGTLANSECTFTAQRSPLTGKTAHVYRNWL